MEIRIGFQFHDYSPHSMKLLFTSHIVQWIAFFLRRSRAQLYKPILNNNHQPINQCKYLLRKKYHNATIFQISIFQKFSCSKFTWIHLPRNNSTLQIIIKNVLGYLSNKGHFSCNNKIWKLWIGDNILALFQRSFFTITSLIKENQISFQESFTFKVLSLSKLRQR